MNGIAVHGKSGNRKSYKPLETVLCNSSNPQDIVSKYKDNGAEKLYIADLDAIMGNGNNFKLIKELDIYKMVDFGIRDKKDLEHIRNLKLCDKIIVGTETLSDIKLLNINENEFIKIENNSNVTDKNKNKNKNNNLYTNVQDIIISLDFKDGKLLNYKLEYILNNINKNIPLIVLDISSVGTKKGINKNLVNKILDETKNPIYIGGGIKDENDLKEAYELGVDGVLIATAIHSGILNLRDIIEKYR